MRKQQRTTGVVDCSAELTRMSAQPNYAVSLELRLASYVLKVSVCTGRSNVV